MKRLIFLALVLPAIAFGAWIECWVTGETNLMGDTNIGDAVGDAVTVAGTMTMQEAMAFDVGTAALPGIYFDGDPNSGFYWIGADDIGITAAGGAVGNFDGTGLNTCDIGQTNAAEGDFTTGSFTGDVDFAVGLVGQPSLTFTGDVDTGIWSSGADMVNVSVGGAEVGEWDGTGLTADGLNAPLGTVVPAAATVTDLDVGGLFNFGQDPVDLIGGYKQRGTFITYQDDFSISVDTEYVLDWDLTTVVGVGTNTVSVRPGWSEMVTGGAGVDSESTQSFGLIIDRAFEPRMESVVEFTDLVTQRFEWGFYIAANECVTIVYDVAIGATWVLQVDDTAGIETIDSLVAATVDPTKLEIVVAADGTVTWAIDDVVMTVVGLTNQMTANPHYIWWESTDTAAAAHTTAVDYVIVEQLRQQ